MTMNELTFFWFSLAGFLVSGIYAWGGHIFLGRLLRGTGLMVLVSWLLLTVGLIIRWVRLDHGPFTTMYEILGSNIWSFVLFFLIIYWRMPRIRILALLFLPVIYAMFAWMLMVPKTDVALPNTYNTAWLYVHISFGKVFMGALIISMLVSVVILVRQFLDRWIPDLPGERSLLELSYRFLLIALVFDSLMLIGGAIWAQQAWGRYWFWDSLETWSFISWLSIAVAVHLKITLKPEPAYFALFIIFIFIISFLTFFGVPFVNEIPHKGVV